APLTSRGIFTVHPLRSGVIHPQNIRPQQPTRRLTTSTLDRGTDRSGTSRFVLKLSTLLTRSKVRTPARRNGDAIQNSRGPTNRHWSERCRRPPLPKKPRQRRPARKS